MNIDDLKRKLLEAESNAFYSECLDPKTEADTLHNQSLSADINYWQTLINEYAKQNTNA